MSETRQSSNTGVHQYFFFIKEKVSSDWKDLAFHLEFFQADIDNIAGRNRDDKSRCMDLLEEWLKRNGERATIEVLMEALTGANLQSTVDGLKSEYPELQSPQASSSQLKRKNQESDQFPAKKEGSPIDDVFQNAVKKYNEMKLTNIKPLIWNDNFTLTLSDIFTNLTLKSTHGVQHKMPDGNACSRQRTRLRSLDDLFNPDVTGRPTAPRCILIEGEAGAGKTTFLSKEVLDAVSQKTELGRRHDIVLLIRLREVREGETIEEMAWDQCVPETTEGVDVQSIRSILQRNESRVLFLLDGYDELRPEAKIAGQAIPKLLSGKMYLNSTIVITSRPSAGIQKYTQPDCCLHLIGFSNDQMRTFVEQYFRLLGRSDLGDEFISQFFMANPWPLSCASDESDNDDYDFFYLKNDALLTSLMETPMFLMLVCVLWEEDQEMLSTGTMTGLYDNVLTCLVRKYCKREGVDIPADGLPAEVADALLHFGRLALEALLRNETLLDLAQVDRENVDWEMLLKLGVVSLEVSASKLHPRKQLNFPHKTMQEFLAGKYVAHVLLNQDVGELLQLTSIPKALELGNLLQFTCGCNSGAAQAVVRELGDLRRKEFATLHPEQFEKSHVPMKREQQTSLETYKEFVKLCLIILSERQEPDVMRAFSQALPIVILDVFVDSRRDAGFQYYMQNLSAENLPDRLMLNISNDYKPYEMSNSRNTVQYLQQCFTRSFPGLKLDLKLGGHFDSGLVSAMNKVPGLRALDLSRTDMTLGLSSSFDYWNEDIGDDGIEVLKAGLPSVSQLAVLRLRSVSMSDVGMSSLTNNMCHLAGLRELDIAGNCIGDAGVESLATVLPTFIAMQVLVLEDIGISANGMRTLVPALRQLPKVIKLDIACNCIGDAGLEYLASILHHLTAMKVLMLQDTHIGDKGVFALVKVLPYLVELQVLQVTENKIGDSGIAALVQTLGQPKRLATDQKPTGANSRTVSSLCNTTLQELGITDNSEVTGAGLGRVAELIGALTALTELDMSGYVHPGIYVKAAFLGPVYYPLAYLSDTAAMALAEALPRLLALERLNLLHISMEPAGFQAVVQSAEEHPTLKELMYCWRGVPEGADISASCLKLL